MNEQEDQHYPTVDFEFIDSLIRSSQKLAGVTVVGRTNAYILVGSRPIAKRTIPLRPSNDNKVGFMQATAIAYKLGKLDDLLKWYEQHCNWKDGGYVAK
jgi:hypothetical protein